VTIEGKLSPETKAAQEAVLRREGELAQRGAVRAEERANLDRGNEEALDKVAKHHDEQIAAQRAEGQRVLDDLAERRAAKLKEIEDGKVEPTRLWQGSKGTQNAIAAGLAVALGSVGSALAGGPNAGLGAVEKAVDRDIALQEQAIDKKHKELGELGKLYQSEKERLGDKLAARNEVKIAALTSVKATAERYAKIANSEDAYLKLQQIQLQTDAKIAELRAKNEDRIKEVQSYKTIMPATGGGAPKKKATGGVTLMVPDGKGGFKDRYVTFPAGMSEGTKNEFIKRAQGANKAQLSLRNVQEKRGSGVPINDEDVQAFAQSYTYRYAEAEGQGQATADQEKSVADKLRSSLGGGGRAIDAYQRSIDQVQEEIYRQLTPPEQE